jgi:hypothetical protein
LKKKQKEEGKEMKKDEHDENHRDTRGGVRILGQALGLLIG